LNLTAQARDLLGATVEQFQQMGFICHWIDNEATLLWSKLALLAPLALTTSAAGAPKGEVAASPYWREQLESCVREACSVAKAEGAKVDPDVGLAALLGLPDAMRSSMQKDIEQGNPPELDAIAGPILRGGERHGIPVPVTRGLVTIVESKAQAKA
jgi:2-dehydropantoate 2-reductase